MLKSQSHTSMLKAQAKCTASEEPTRSKGEATWATLMREWYSSCTSVKQEKSKDGRQVNSGCKPERMVMFLILCRRTLYLVRRWFWAIRLTDLSTAVAHKIGMREDVLAGWYCLFVCGKALCSYKARTFLLAWRRPGETNDVTCYRPMKLNPFLKQPNKK
jgi:hypothetical protein